MKIDKNICVGFVSALSLHAAFFTADFSKFKTHFQRDDLIFEQSVSSVEVSFAPMPVLKQPEKKVEKKIEEVKKNDILKDIKIEDTQDAVLKIPKEEKIKKEKKAPEKKIEKSIIKEKRGVSKKVVEPVQIYNQAPVYPLFAVRMGYEGTVLLVLSINKKGKVTEVSIKTSSGHQLLDRSAVSAAKSWIFSPATKSGHAIIYTKEVPVVFRLKNA